MRRFIIAGVAAFSCMAVMAVSLSAQQSFGRMGGKGGMKSDGQQKYDASQAGSITGEVIAVKDIETRNGKTSGVGLELNTGNQSLLVYLGPHIYVDLQNVRINVGDNVEVKGVKVLLDGQQAVIAGEVQKGNEVLKLRDDNGVPLWVGKSKGAHGVN